MWMATALKGFVAHLRSLASYGLTLLGALGIGVVESFSAFMTSAYKETIVFLLVIRCALAVDGAAASMKRSTE